MRAEEPQSAIKTFYQSKIFNEETGISKCPSFSKYYKNVFYLKSIYDYEFTIDPKTKNVASNMYNQDFYNRHVVVRDAESKMFSFSTQFIFFTEEKSLEMNLEQPSLDYRFSLSNISVIPGTMDIGKWYRTVDWAFFLKDGYNTFKINEGDIFYQLRFITNQKINFIRFLENEELKKYRDLVEDSKKNKNKTKSLEYYYSIFNMKSKILKEIKKNTI